MEKFSAHIKRLREENKLSLEELGHILGVGNSAVSKWENNETTPNDENLTAIADYFKEDFKKLLKMSGDEKKDRKIRKKQEEKNNTDKPPPNFSTTDNAKHEAEMNLATALALIKDLRGDTSQLGNTIHRQTIMIENLINRDTEKKLIKITEDITMRLQSLTDVLAQVGAGHRFSDENAVLRQIGIKDAEFVLPHRERKRTDIRKSDM